MIYSDSLNPNRLESGQSLTKLCPNCSNHRYYKEFSYRADGRLESWCRSCNRIRAKEYRKRQNSWKERERSWKRRGILNSNGLPFLTADFIELRNKQNYSCAICLRNEGEFQRGLAVDHNHKTGKVRGLLCFKCNKGMGHFDERISIYYRIISYLS